MNRERSERRKIEKNLRFGHKKIIGPRPLGGRAPGAPPGSASVTVNVTSSYMYKRINIS